MERELRRYQNLLVCVGSGVITFGIWSVIKVIMTMVRDKDEWLEFMEYIFGPEYAGAGMFILILASGIVIAIDLIIRLYIGSSARKDGFGRRNGKRRVYLVLAIILAIFTVGSIITNFRDVLQYGSLVSYLNDDVYTGAYIMGVLDIVVKTIVDFTSLVMIFELVVGAVKVERLEKMIKAAAQKEGVS